MWKVLLADDEPFVREGLEKLIPWEEMGYQLEGSYKNGRDLLENVPGVMPDLVILDIQMPFLNGLETAKILHEEWPEIVVILLTAYAEFQYAQQALKYEVKGYVLKSNLLIELPKTLQEMTALLEQKRQLRQKIEEFTQGDVTALPEEHMDGGDGESSDRHADDLIRLVQSYVEERIASKLTLDEIADAVHVNRSYLSRLYKQKTGENLFGMINRIRVEKAKKYIREGNKKIYEIAYMVGMDDTAYFSRVFKQYAGCSPKEYENLPEVKGEKV